MGKLNKDSFSKINPNAAGIDVGGEFHFVAIPEQCDEKPVRQFASFTRDLNQLADWLSENGITTVAMESTSVYWIPIYEILEARGFEVLLVNARHVKTVPGRKSDVLDCQWLQQLHTFGLLRASFRPEDAICQLRAYMRQRESLIQYASSHIQHMQKALVQMNVQLSNVVSDITGVTGLKIIRAIVEGERRPNILASHRDGRCKKSREEIEQSLYGNYRDEHLFNLRQALELYDIYQTKLAECDSEIEHKLKQLSADKEDSFTSTPPQSRRKRRKNELHFDARMRLKQLIGVDLTKIDGLDAHSALKLVAEIGTNIDKWPNAKHFGSWLGLSPGAKISGGKVLSSRTKPSSNRAATTLRVAASTLHHSQSALGAYYRRQKSRLGAPKAMTATAYKIARLVYTMMKKGEDYVDAGQDYYEKQYKKRIISNIRKKLQQFGYELTPMEINTG